MLTFPSISINLIEELKEEHGGKKATKLPCLSQGLTSTTKDGAVTRKALSVARYGH